MSDDTRPDLHEPTEEDQTESLADIVGVDLVPMSIGSIPVVPVNGVPHVVFRHAVESLGLDYRAALRRIRAREWATVVVLTTVARHGKRLPMVTTDVRTFIGFLFLLTPRQVRRAVRPALIAYQREALDALYDYASKGLAINPRGRTPEQIRLIEAAGEGLIGPVMEHSKDAYGALQYLEGQRDMPSGMTKATATARLYKAVRRIHESVIDAGLDAAWALKRAQ